MKYIKLYEKYNKTITLFHGTSENNANLLINNGWKPNKILSGGNMGQSKYLYLTTDKEDALWFAEESGNNTILKISDIPLDYIRFDPEDGDGDLFNYNINVAINKINNGYQLPIKFVLCKELGKEHFEKLK